MQTISERRFLFAISMLFFSFSIKGQDAARILEECINASRKLSSYTCTVYDSTTFSGVANYRVIQQRAEVKDILFGKAMYSLSGFISEKGSEPKPLSLVYSGADVRILDPADNSVYLFTEPSARQLGVFTSRLAYPIFFTLPFWNEKPGQPIENTFVSVEYAGAKNILGTDCELIRCGRKLKRPDTGEESIVYIDYLIGKQDHICRGYEADHERVWVKMEEYDHNYAFSSFVLSTPAGFSEKKVSSYTPPNKKGLLQTGENAPPYSPAGMVAQNKIVLLDFWGTWCGPCRLAMPQLQALHEKYKNKGLEVIGISVADADGAPEKYMKDMKYTYGLITHGENTARAYQVDAFPTIYLIGKDGKIIHAEKGTREDFVNDISKLIEQVLR